MSDIKVSMLASASTSYPDDAFMVVQQGVSKKITISALLNNLDSYGDVKFNPSKNAVSFGVSSRNFSPILFVDGVNDKVGINTSTPLELFHVAGNVRADGVYRGSTESVGSGSPLTNATISISVESTALNITGASTYLLGNGYDGQTKYIYADAVAGGAIGVITLAGSGFTTITFASTNYVNPGTGTLLVTGGSPIGYGVTLKYLKNAWVCMGNNNTKLA